MNTHRARTLRILFSTTIASVFVVALPAAPANAGAGECSTGAFCVWTGTHFTGRIQEMTTTNAYRSISLGTTRSYYNNRSKRTWLHSRPNGDGSTVCINPGASNGSTSGWQQTAKAAFLAAVVSC